MCVVEIILKMKLNIKLLKRKEMPPDASGPQCSERVDGHLSGRV